MTLSELLNKYLVINPKANPAQASVATAPRPLDKKLPAKIKKVSNPVMAAAPPDLLVDPSIPKNDEDWDDASI